MIGGKNLESNGNSEKKAQTIATGGTVDGSACVGGRENLEKLKSNS